MSIYAIINILFSHLKSILTFFRLDFGWMCFSR